MQEHPTSTFHLHPQGSGFWVLLNVSLLNEGNRKELIRVGDSMLKLTLFPPYCGTLEDSYSHCKKCKRVTWTQNMEAHAECTECIVQPTDSASCEHCLGVHESVQSQPQFHHALHRVAICTGGSPLAEVLQSFLSHVALNWKRWYFLWCFGAAA